MKVEKERGITGGRHPGLILKLAKLLWVFTAVSLIFGLAGLVIGQEQEQSVKDRSAIVDVSDPDILLNDQVVDVCQKSEFQLEANAQLKRSPTKRAKSIYVCLEPRKMLAGGVSAVKTNNVLTITGDASANEMIFKQIGNRSWSVAPKDIFPPNDVTTINGQLQPVIFSGIDSIVMAMGGGRDAVQVVGKSGLQPHQSLEVGLGDGDDWFELSNLFGTSAQIRGFKGSDTIQIHNSTIDGVFADLGEASSSPGFQIGTFSGSFRTLEVMGGSGKELISIGLCLANHVSIDTGAGNDLVNARGIHGGYTTDHVQSLSIRLGQGNDELHFEVNAVINLAFFRGGSGTDKYVWYGGGTGHVITLDSQGFEQFVFQ